MADLGGEQVDIETKFDTQLKDVKVKSAAGAESLYTSPIV